MKVILPKININIERWKYNKDYEIYVSTLGNFKDKNKKTLPLKIHSGKGYVMIPTPHGIKAAHRLVMLTFKPDKNASELTVDHLDHNKRNNSLDEAVEWLVAEKLIMPNSSILKLKKGIKHSIRTQKPYCNMQWDLV